MNIWVKRKNSELKILDSTSYKRFKLLSLSVNFTAYWLMNLSLIRSNLEVPTFPPQHGFVHYMALFNILLHGFVQYILTHNCIYLHHNMTLFTIFTLLPWSLYYHYILATGKLASVDVNNAWLEGTILTSLMWNDLTEIKLNIFRQVWL